MPRRCRRRQASRASRSIPPPRSGRVLQLGACRWPATSLDPLGPAWFAPSLGFRGEALVRWTWMTWATTTVTSWQRDEIRVADTRAVGGRGLGRDPSVSVRLLRRESHSGAAEATVPNRIASGLARTCHTSRLGLRYAPLPRRRSAARRVRPVICSGADLGPQSARNRGGWFLSTHWVPRREDRSRLGQGATRRRRGR